MEMMYSSGSVSEVLGRGLVVTNRVLIRSGGVRPLSEALWYSGFVLWRLDRSRLPLWRVEQEAVAVVN